MKPRVFLSHSKADRSFIVGLANDLRAALVDVWVDEWEIPPGSSFSRKIFDEGLPNSDLFFVYLTSDSIKSYWVRKELDAALVNEADSQANILATFADSDETRGKLSVDIRTLHVPLLNSEFYEQPVRQIVARSWEGLLRRRVAEVEDKNEKEILTLQRDVADQRAYITQLESERTSGFSVQETLKRIGAITYKINGAEIKLNEIFSSLANDIAIGTTHLHLNKEIRDVLIDKGLIEAPKNERPGIVMLREIVDYEVSDFIGPLITLGLVEIRSFEENGDSFYLTEFGKKLAMDSHVDQ